MTVPSRAAHLAAALALVVAAPALRAQQLPTNLPSAAAQAVASRPVTPFRKGQWGLEFAVDQYAPHLGFLKFRSPTKAWVLDVAVGGGMGKSETEETDGTIAEQSGSAIATDVLLGIRSYRALTPRAVRTIQFGITGRHAFSESEAGGVTTANSTSYGAGVKLSLGGAYFFTPGLSLGGDIGLAAAWNTGESNTLAGSTQRNTGINYGLGGGQIRASLFF